MKKHKTYQILIDMCQYIYILFRLFCALDVVDYFAIFVK